MKKLSVYFVDGKSLAFTLDENEYARFLKWLNDNENKPFKVVNNKMEHFIFKHAIEYVIS